MYLQFFFVDDNNDIALQELHTHTEIDTDDNNGLKGSLMLRTSHSNKYQMRSTIKV